jgi:hypothetical protein
MEVLPVVVVTPSLSFSVLVELIYLAKRLLTEYIEKRQG